MSTEVDDLIGAVNVSICVCTYKRAEGLARLLASLERLKCPLRCSIEVVVVDNDAEGSARAQVEAASINYPWPLRYSIEPNSGVSHARNRCVAEARAEWIAFVDDDEWVKPDWLGHLVRMANKTGCDVVMSSVIPVFEIEVPAWIEGSGAFVSIECVSGTTPSWKQCATGNVLMRRELLMRMGGFDPVFGASGAEDSDYFFRCARAGVPIVWCHEAMAYEGIPAGRLTRDWVLRRGVAAGRNYARICIRYNGWRTEVAMRLRGLLAWAAFGIASLLARAIRPRLVARFERIAAMGFGKMTPFRGEAGKHYGDARA